MSLLAATMAQIIRAGMATASYEVFLASGTFNVPAGISSVDVLLVAGGGGGGGFASFDNGGGGGGAGGVRVASSVVVTPSGTVSVTVGAGGTAGSSGQGGNGGASSFGAQSVTGGGGGQGYTGSAYQPVGTGRNGGSGGGCAGAGSGSQTGGTGVSGEGFAGGALTGGGAQRPASGGGGKSAAGGAVTANVAGAGGAGITLASIGWDAAIAEGAPSAVGGGGGGGRNGGDAGAGGTGGGGAGASSGAGNPGTANTGGGGGGSGTGSALGGVGGAGLVVVRYPSLSPPWTPAAIATELWLDADDAGSFSLTGSDINQWNDKSGNARHVTPTGTKPTRNASLLNSKGGVVFGNGTPLLSSSFANPSGADGVMVVMVIRRTSAPVNFSVPFCKGAVNTQYSTVWANPSQSNISYWRNNTAGGNTAGSPASTLADNVDYIWSGRISNAGIDQYMNGTLLSGSQGAATRSFGASSAMTLGSSTTIDNRFLGNLHEFALVHGDVTAATRQRLEGYLAHKWGLAGSLPGDHPYKAAPPTI